MFTRTDGGLDGLLPLNSKVDRNKVNVFGCVPLLPDLPTALCNRPRKRRSEMSQSQSPSSREWYCSDVAKNIKQKPTVM